MDARESRRQRSIHRRCWGVVSAIRERIGDRRIWRDAVAYLETNVYFLLASASEVLCVHAC